MYASFQNVLFVFDNGTDDDLSAYQYELYQEEDIVDPNNSPYELKSSVTPLRSGNGNSSVFAIPVEGSYVDEDNGNIVVQKNFFGRVRAIDTSGNPGQWTSIRKTDPSTPLIDSQYVVSLTADKIKAGEIESAAITLGGANPEETIIQSKTYATSSGASGWYIDGLGEFSLGGPEGINYNGSSITIGSDVQVTANLAADSISVGSGLTQLNINDAINGGSGGMSIGSGGNNYWYTDGSFRVGNLNNYVRWNPNVTPPNTPVLEVVGQVTATSGTIGGWQIKTDSIKSSNNLVTLSSDGSITIGNDSSNFASITNTGDFLVVGSDGTNLGHSQFRGPFFNVSKGLPFSGNTANAQYTYKNFVFFKSTPGAYGVWINGGNDSTNAFIDVGATGITDASSISCSGWFRSSGASGWYSQTYGGGIWMTDTTTVRVYADKNFATAGVISAGQLTSVSAFIDSGSNNFATMALKRAFSAADKRFISFVNAIGGQAGSIEYDGSATKVKYNVTSDARIKTNIKKIDSALLKVKQFNPVTFNYIDTDVEHDGFLAQELYEVYKNPITKPDNEEDYWMMDYSSLTPILTAAIKELSDKIDEIEKNINNQ